MGQIEELQKLATNIQMKLQTSLLRYSYVVFLFLMLVRLEGFAQQIKPFKDHDRIAFLGNSITDGGHYHSYIWLYYLTRFPQMDIRILNTGVGGDRAIEMLKRLDGDVFAKKPTTIVVTFGMNDSGYQEYNGPEPEKFADERVKQSYDAFQEMIKKFKQHPDIRIVVVGSTPYDENTKIDGNEPFKNKNKAMLRIVDFQKEMAEKNQWDFFDYNTTISDIHTKFQKNDPTFTLSGKDRIHPDNDGHMVMAYLFLKAQGFAGQKVSDFSIDTKSLRVSNEVNCSITNVKAVNNGLVFQYKANALPYPLDTIARGWGNEKSQFAAMKIVPFMDEMNQELMKINGLKGEFQVLIDNEKIGVFTGAELAKGLNLATKTNTPQYQQALRLMHLNEERWEIDRRFRDYAWIQYNFFQPKGMLEANNRAAIDTLDKYQGSNGWLAAKRDLYSKAMFPEVRKAWQDQMELLLQAIRRINQPVNRKIEIFPVSK